MSIANVANNSTFEQWLVATNQLIVVINELLGGTLSITSLNVSGNLTVTQNVTANFIELNGNDIGNALTNLYIEANSTLVSVNTAGVNANTAGSIANGAFTTANASYGQANTGTLVAQGAFTTANAAYGLTNTVTAIAIGAFGGANNAQTLATAAFNSANTGVTTAKGAFTTANASYGQANTGTLVAQGAFTTANAAYGQDNVTLSIAQGAFTTANAAYGKANNITATSLGALAIDNNLSDLNNANTARQNLGIAFQYFTIQNGSYIFPGNFILNWNFINASSFSSTGAGSGIFQYVWGFNEVFNSQVLLVGTIPEALFYKAEGDPIVGICSLAFGNTTLDNVTIYSTGTNSLASNVYVFALGF